MGPLDMVRNLQNLKETPSYIKAFQNTLYQLSLHEISSRLVKKHAQKMQKCQGNANLPFFIERFFSDLVNRSKFDLATFL